MRVGGLFSAGAISALIAVAAGAFGAHALRARLTPDALAIFETGARYQMYHALAIGLAAFAMRKLPGGVASAAAGFFFVGIVLFSGSLYVLALTGVREWGIVTPFGGMCFLIGWLLLALAAWRMEA